MWRKNEGRQPTGNVVQVKLFDGTVMVVRNKHAFRWEKSEAGSRFLAGDIVEYDDGQEPEGQGNDFALSRAHYAPNKPGYIETRRTPPASPELKKIRDEIATLLPTNAKVRKGIPVYSGAFRYFPRALLAVAELSRIGNDQHNPGEPLHWAREKSGDELDALGRHLLEAGTIDTDGVRHSTKIAWRALANLEKELEAAQ